MIEEVFDWNKHLTLVNSDLSRSYLSQKKKGKIKDSLLRDQFPLRSETSESQVEFRWVLRWAV